MRKAPIFPSTRHSAQTKANAAAVTAHANLLARSQTRARLRMMICSAALVALVGIGGMTGGFANIAPVSLDTIAARANDDANPIDSATQTFTGSAHFFAEGAFDTGGRDAAAGNRHVLPLRKVESALASPFYGANAIDRYRALNCLTSAIYYEAGNEPDEGQQAVAQVVLNRVRHPAWPKSVCGVVYQGSERTDMLCQFTFSCDGAMARTPAIDKWARARRVAENALAGKVFAPAGLSTYYHTLAVRPYWSSKLDPVAVVGAHIFYQMRGKDGAPLAFRAPYTGRELISGPPPRIWKPMPTAATPAAMPYLPDMIVVDSTGAYSAPIKGAGTAGPTASVSGGSAAPGNNGTSTAGSHSPSAPTEHGLPQSGIRPEYQNSGRPLL